MPREALGARHDREASQPSSDPGVAVVAGNRAQLKPARSATNCLSENAHVGA